MKKFNFSLPDNAVERFLNNLLLNQHRSVYQDMNKDQKMLIKMALSYGRIVLGEELYSKKSESRSESKATLTLDLLLETENKWRVSIDDQAKSFVVYHGSEDICGGYFDPESERIKDLEFMNPEYRKNNKTRVKAIDMIKKAFPGYK